MKVAVLDSSAILAAIHDEPGGEIIKALVESKENHLLISSVNFCEVVTKLVRDGVTPQNASEILRWWRQYVVDFDLAGAEQAGELVKRTQSAGLSLGDRACLALAMSNRATVFTTDKAWNRLNLNLSIQLLR